MCFNSNVPYYPRVEVRALAPTKISLTAAVAVLFSFRSTPDFQFARQNYQGPFTGCLAILYNNSRQQTSSASLRTKSKAGDRNIP